MGQIISRYNRFEQLITKNFISILALLQCQLPLTTSIC